MTIRRVYLCRAFYLVMLVASLLVSGSRGLNVEGQYLLGIKSKMRDEFSHLVSWNPNDQTPCGWKGVNCTYDYDPVIYSLDLNSMNLSGILSPSIGGLMYLSYLDLSFNRFSGSIPAEIGKCSKLEFLFLNNNNFEGNIPPELGSLSSLITCNICNNKLSGSFPEEIGNLSSLEELVTYSNNLSGPLPRTMGRLKNLSVFRAGQNLISGSIPVEISECYNIRMLGLAQNNLGGEIPKEIGKLKYLSELILWDNQLSGVVPKELGNCTSLDTIALYQNNLVGGIPAEIGNLHSLQYLYIYRNGLNGTIPKELGNLSIALEIDFSENFLTGEIPAELSNIKGLRLLHLFQNKLTGFIPIELCELRNLTKLDLSINSLTGPIPVGLQYLPKLLQLQLFDNKLSGVIPQALGVYSPLWVVDFSDNNLTGQIPTHLCRHSNLILLNLWSNKLNGNIPSGVTNCKSLVQLRLGGNSFTGSFPAELCNLENLTAIELDQNRFSGPLPSEIGNCKSLQRLIIPNNYFTSELPREIGNLSGLVVFNISSNKFGGFIPPDIFSCRMLQRLDLSQNHFVGSVPVEIGTLLQLELLYLSDNKFLGMIPSILGKLSHLTELQMGGNQFSGAIPKELGGLSSLQIAMNLSYNNLSGEMPPELGNLALLEFLLLNNNHLTGEIPSTFENLSSLLGLNVSYNNLSGVLPAIPLFRNLALSSFAGNRGLCGGPLGSCNHPSISASPSLKRSGNPRGKIIAIVSAVIGGISLVLIGVILYFMRRPVETVAPLQDKQQLSSSVSSMYICPKEKFSFQDLVAATNNFDEGFVVGRGACGTVYRAVMHSGLVIAVKKLASNREGNNTDNSFLAEISTLGKIRHRNIVKLYGYCYHQGSNLLLYEYMSRGSLGELLHGEASSLDWNTRYMIALGAAEGLSYLHHDCKPHIIHRDIKSNNILLDEKFEAHVGDFGLAKVIDMSYSKSMSAVAGSYGYIAPEYAYTMKVTEKCDIYSYGVVLLELLTGRTPVQPLDVGGDLVTWITSVAPKIAGLQEVLPKSIGLLPFDGGIAGCQRIVHEQLTWGTKSELKAEVLHGLKEIGSAIYWMGLLDLVLREVDTTQFMQTVPWLGMIPGSDGQVKVAECGNSPIVDLFKFATTAIVHNPVCPNPSSFKTMSKQAEAADILYKTSMNSGSVLEYALAFTSAALDKHYSKWSATPKTGFINITTSKDFYRIFSGLQFGYLEETILDHSKNHELLGDSVAWAGCTIVYLLGQQLDFELFDFSYQFLNIAEVENATVLHSISSDRSKNASSLQGYENLLEAMKKVRRLNNHVFSMLKARCPLEDKVACAIKQSGAPLHRVRFVNTVSAFETLPQKGA